jgi:hypothetical protein
LLNMRKSCGKFLSTIVSILAALAAVVSTYSSISNYRYIYNKDAEAVKVAQVNKITAWAKGLSNIELTDGLTEGSQDGRIIVSNTSDSPIFDVVISFGVISGAGRDYRTGDDGAREVGTVPPGKWIAKAPYPGEGMFIQLGAAISFTDARGVSWLRTPKGVLREIDRTPPEYMKLLLPVEPDTIEEYE